MGNIHIIRNYQADIFNKFVRVRRYTEKQKKKIALLKNARKEKLKTFNKRKEKFEQFKKQNQKIIDEFFKLENLVNDSDNQIEKIDNKLYDIRDENIIIDYVPVR